MAVKQIAKINYDVNTVSSIYDIQALGLNYKTGTGTAAVTATPFCFSKWDVTDTSIAEYYDGLTIAYKVPVAGNSTYGTCLQINNLGYHPVVRATNSMIGTRYGVGAIVLLVYTTSLSGSVYGTSSGTGASAAANISGVWVCVNDADNNSNTLLRTYASTANIELPIAGISTGSTTPSTSTYTSGYKDSYGQIPSTVANRPTINLSTGVLTVPAGIDGTATRATADANGNNIASTYATKTHSHGKINSDGTITLSGTGNGTASIVTNGRFLITQNDGTIYASQLAFNTTTTDYAKYALTQYGTWEEFGSGSGTFIIKMSYNSSTDTYSIDKTAAEIDQAYEDGIPMIVYTTFPVFHSGDGDPLGSGMFNLSLVESWISSSHQFHQYTFTCARFAALSNTSIITQDSTEYSIESPYGYEVSTIYHTHGSINRYGQIGSTSNRALYTKSSGTITAGTLPIAAGGTGATTSAAALTNLGAAAATHYHDDRYLQLSGGTMTGALTLSGDPTSNLQAATKQYVDQSFAANDAMVFQGTIGPSSSTVTALPASHSAGDTYRVNVSATTSYAGQACENGDLIICIRDGSSASNDDWTVVQTNLDGVVIGPSSATDGHIATFNGTSGDLIQDSGYTTASFAAATHSHGNITSDGKVGSTASKALYTGTAGTVTAGTLPVAAGGTGLATVTSGSVLIGNGTSALSTRAITNNTSATTATTNSNLITNSTLYYATANINNARQTSNVSIYAPTGGGSAGQLLTASGSTSAPVWTNTGNITVGAAIKDGAGNTISTYYAAGTHSHGYISSTGTISLSGTNPGTTTIENGGRLMITNASGTIFASRLSFNTTSNTYANYALTQYGTWEEFSKGAIIRTWS